MIGVLSDRPQRTSQFASPKDSSKKSVPRASINFLLANWTPNFRARSRTLQELLNMRAHIALMQRQIHPLHRVTCRTRCVICNSKRTGFNLQALVYQCFSFFTWSTQSVTAFWRVQLAMSRSEHPKSELLTVRTVSEVTWNSLAGMMLQIKLLIIESSLMTRSSQYPPLQHYHCIFPPRTFRYIASSLLLRGMSNPYNSNEPVDLFLCLCREKLDSRMITEHCNYPVTANCRHNSFQVALDKVHNIFNNI